MGVCLCPSRLHASLWRLSGTTLPMDTDTISHLQKPGSYKPLLLPGTASLTTLARNPSWTHGTWMMNMHSCCTESFSSSVNSYVMLLSSSFCRWPLEVIRRASYKGGKEKCKFKTPVDCATVPGMILCLSSVLQNRGLTNTSVQKVWRVFEVFDKQSSMNQRLALLPDLQVEARENMVRIEDWHAALQRLGFGALVELTTRLEVGESVSRHFAQFMLS